MPAGIRPHISQIRPATKQANGSGCNPHEAGSVTLAGLHFAAVMFNSSMSAFQADRPGATPGCRTMGCKHCSDAAVS